MRTLGYVRAWAEKYEDKGLVVVGVHTPEFPFERRVDNVRWAVQKDRIAYPVAIDSKYGVWQAFANHYWFISPTPRVESATTTSARAPTRNAAGRPDSFGPDRGVRVEAERGMARRGEFTLGG